MTNRLAQAFPEFGKDDNPEQAPTRNRLSGLADPDYSEQGLRSTVKLPEEDIEAPPPVGSEGVLGGLAEAGRGLVRTGMVAVPEMAGKAAQYFDPEGGSTAVGDWGVGLREGSKQWLQDNPEFKQSLTARKKKEENAFSVHGSAGEATEMLGPSLAPTGIGVGIGAVLGGIGGSFAAPGPGTAVGAVAGAKAGAWVGTAIGLAGFFGSAAQDTEDKVFKAQMETLTKSGLSEAEAEPQARGIAKEAGLKSGAIEAGGELVSKIPVFRVLRLLPKKAKSNAVKAATDVMRNPKALASDLLKVMGAEISTELAQTAGQQYVEADAGAGEMPTWDSVKGVIMPTAIMSGLTMGIAEPMGMGQRRALTRTLADAEAPVEDRINAVETVARSIKDPELAQMWRAHSVEQIKAEAPIVAEEDVFYAEQEIARKAKEKIAPPPTEGQVVQPEPQAYGIEALRRNSTDAGLDVMPRGSEGRINLARFATTPGDEVAGLSQLEQARKERLGITPGAEREAAKRAQRGDATQKAGSESKHSGAQESTDRREGQQAEGSPDRREGGRAEEEVTTTTQQEVIRTNKAGKPLKSERAAKAVRRNRNLSDWEIKPSEDGKAFEIHPPREGAQESVPTLPAETGRVALAKLELAARSDDSTPEGRIAATKSELELKGSATKKAMDLAKKEAEALGVDFNEISQRKMEELGNPKKLVAAMKVYSKASREEARVSYDAKKNNPYHDYSDAELVLIEKRLFEESERIDEEIFGAQTRETDDIERQAIAIELSRVYAAQLTKTRDALVAVMGGDKSEAEYILKEVFDIDPNAIGAAYYANRNTKRAASSYESLEKIYHALAYRRGMFGPAHDSMISINLVSGPRDKLALRPNVPPYSLWEPDLLAESANILDAVSAALVGKGVDGSYKDALKRGMKRPSKPSREQKRIAQSQQALSPAEARKREPVSEQATDQASQELTGLDDTEGLKRKAREAQNFSDFQGWLRGRYQAEGRSFARSDKAKQVWETRNDEATVEEASKATGEGSTGGAKGQGVLGQGGGGNSGRRNQRKMPADEGSGTGSSAKKNTVRNAAAGNNDAIGSAGLTTKDATPEKDQPVSKQDGIGKQRSKVAAEEKAEELPARDGVPADVSGESGKDGKEGKTAEGDVKEPADPGYAKDSAGGKSAISTTKRAIDALVSSGREANMSLRGYAFPISREQADKVSDLGGKRLVRYVPIHGADTKGSEGWYLNAVDAYLVIHGRKHVTNKPLQALVKEIEGRAGNVEEPVSGYGKASYAGPKAVTADKSAMEQAVRMEQQGVDMETIRKETGWNLGLDDKWKYEISDEEMSLKQNPKRYPGSAAKNGRPAQLPYVKLGDLVYHPALFKAYPELREVRVETTRTGGYYDPSTNTIGAPYHGKAAKLDVLIHEVQHIIQRLEGFATGGNSGANKNYNKLAGEIEARDAAGRRMMTPAQRDKLAPSVAQGISKEEAAVQFDNQKRQMAIGKRSARHRQRILGQEAKEVAELRQQLEREFGKARIARLEKQGKLQVHYRAEDMPGGGKYSGAQAVFIDGTIHINAEHTSNAADGLAAAVLAHEQTHASERGEGRTKEVLGVGFDKLHGQLSALRDKGDATAVAAFERVPDDTPSADITSEEIAYFVEQAHEQVRLGKSGNLSARAKSLYRRILAAVRAWYLNTKMGKGANFKLTDELAVSLVRASLNRQAETAATKFSRASTAGAKASEVEDAAKEWREKGTDSKYFREWFGDSKVVDEDGQPLVVYHGTNADDFTMFSPEFRGSKTGAPSAKHGYFFVKAPKVATSYAVATSDLEFSKKNIEKQTARSNARLRMEAATDELESYGSFMSDYINGSEAERSAIEEEYAEYPDILSAMEELKNAEKEIQVAQIEDGARILLVYLSLKNPKVVDQDGGYREQSYFDAIKQAKKAGHDGLIIKNTYDAVNQEYSEETDVYVAFSPTQIKSAVGNQGTFDQSNPDIRYSRARKKADVPEGFEDFTNDELDIVRSTLPDRTTKAKVAEVVTTLTRNWKDKVNQGVFDKYWSLKKLDSDAHKLAHLIPSSSGTLEAMLDYGLPTIDSRGVLGLKTTAEERKQDKAPDRGLIKTLSQLGNEVDRFFLWVAANRADGINKRAKAAQHRADRLKVSMADTRKEITRLTNQGGQGAAVRAAKKRLDEMSKERGDALKRADITERFMADDRLDLFLKSNQGKMEGGQDRKKLYDKVWKDFQEFNESVLDIATKTGLISSEQRDLYRNEFYVPFYRVMEEQGTSHGPSAANQLVRQQAWKKYKGSARQLGDLFGNTLMNWNHLLAASLRNQAGVKALKAAVDSGVARKVGKNPKARSKNAIYVKERGEEVWYEVDQDNAQVLESLQMLNMEGMNTLTMRSARKVKRLFTEMVTSTPSFRMANIWRDSIMAPAVNQMSKNIWGNVTKGFKATSKESLTRASMLASGAEVHFGHVLGHDTEAQKELIRKKVNPLHILDNPNAFKSLYKVSRAAWDQWQEVGSRAENINRAAAYMENLKTTGGDTLESAYLSRDIMDFTRHGAWKATRVLIDTVPFLNARLQGLHKLGRSAATPEIMRKQFAPVVGTYVMAGVLLYLANMDDDEFRDEEEWLKDAYHIIKIPGSDVDFKLPKPFELGAIETVAERLAEQIIDDKVHGKLFWTRMMHLLGNTLALDPRPQIVKPMLEVAANKDSFTNRPIESLGMRNLPVTQRKKEWTSNFAVGMSHMLDQIPWDKVKLSPVQVDHMIRGYFGAVGTSVAQYLDFLVLDAATGKPSDPAWRIQQHPGYGRFFKTGPLRRMKYGEQFYSQLTELRKYHSGIRAAKLNKEFELAKEIEGENKSKLKWRKRYNRAQRRISAIRARIKSVRQSDMSREAKRVKEEGLNTSINQIQKNIILSSREAWG